MWFLDLEKKSLFNLTSHWHDTEKNYLYAKDSYKAKNPLLINERKRTDLKRFNDCKFFIEYSIDMNDIYKNIEEYK